MTLGRRWRAASLAAALLATVPTGPVAAQAPACVAVVVVDQAGTTDRDCAEVAPGSDGVAILEAAGHTVRVEGGFVCAIDGHPAEPECGADPSAGGYWGYFHGDGAGGWSYSVYGAQQHRAEDGDVEGWVWQHDNDAGTARRDPPRTRFADICAEPEPDREPTSDPSDAPGDAGSGPEPEPPRDRQRTAEPAREAPPADPTPPDGRGTPTATAPPGSSVTPTPAGASEPATRPTPSPAAPRSVAARGEGPGGFIAALLLGVAIVGGGAVLARRRTP